MILACDIGLKRIGLATCIDSLCLPLPPILRKNREQASEELSNLLRKREVAVLVVGMPDGENGEHAMKKRIEHFVSLLSFGGEIVYVDEGLSSKMAFESLGELSKKERGRKSKNGELDSLAAVIILERYLQQATKEGK
ncbi:Holliday junction resolvase RuvX [Helicobacter enhydrae]|uniref:Holliday junction resolvase RuvX n=1 Tax=Helicobacter enhydrae TaxID=222136 RepID=UPI0009FC17F0|nr:Holliday junction resolvase RuvX [Helicobacter enhydrae]